MILIFIWLLSDDLGGFGLRTNILTANYFNWHPLVMSMAFLLFMTPGIIYNKYSCIKYK